MDMNCNKISDNKIIVVCSKLLQNRYPGYQCCGSGLFIPDSGSELFDSGFRVKKIPDPGSGSASKNPSLINPKKLFLNSRKYDRGCSSRIRILTFYPSRIPDPGIKKALDPGSATLPVMRLQIWNQI